MVNGRGHFYTWGVERVIAWELDVEDEGAAGVGGAFWADDGGLPMEGVLLADGSSRDVAAVGGVPGQFLPLLVEAL